MPFTPNKKPDTSQCPPKPRRTVVLCERQGKPLRLHFDPIDEQGEGISTSGDGENDDPHQGVPEHQDA